VFLSAPVAFADPAGKTTLDQTIRAAKGSGFVALQTGPGEAYKTRKHPSAKPSGARAKHRRSLAFFGQLTDPQIADEMSPACAAIGSAILAPGTVLSARRFARECNATLFAVFGAAFQALLARYSGQADILFLTPFANRTEETESVIGPVANPVCLTGHLAPDTHGLGLAAARAIARQHGGDVLIESAADGCRAILSLPKAA